MSFKGVIEEISKIVRGKEEVIEKALVCFLAGGHLLIEDVPGVGKTALALSLAKVLGLSFSRIQFTSDMLPTDITGTSVYDQVQKEFVFKKGPIFNNVILADEINRATPKAQSALLEAMAEGQVTVDGKTYRLPEPFFVIATQNPIEHYGTYPLPESQLDRFAMRLSVGYPDPKTETEIVMGRNPLEKIETLRVLTSPQEISSVREEVKQIYISEEIARFAVKIVARTRNDPDVILGVSTRGVLHLVSCAKAQAYLRGRDFVVPEDILELAVPVLAHRLVVTEGLAKEEVIKRALRATEVPR